MSPLAFAKVYVTNSRSSIETEKDCCTESFFASSIENSPPEMLASSYKARKYSSAETAALVLKYESQKVAI